MTKSKVPDYPNQSHVKLTYRKGGKFYRAIIHIPERRIHRISLAKFKTATLADQYCKRFKDKVAYKEQTDGTND